MSTSLLQSCFAQPDDLPDALRAEIARRLPGEPIRLIALCDIDASRRFTAAWLALTEHHVVLATPAAASAAHNGAPPASHALQVLAFADVTASEIQEGLSSCRLVLLGRGREVLLTAHYTRRQEHAIARLQFVLDQMRGGAGVDGAARESATVAGAAWPLDAAADYRESVLKAVRENRALLSTQRISVLWRLLGYLRPHRRTMTIGMVLAIIVTALGLVPPLLSQIFIDDIVRPVETGRIGDAWFWLWGVIGALAAVRVISELLSFVRLRVLALTGEKVARRLREDVYAHLHKQSLSFFTTHSTGFTSEFSDLVMKGKSILSISSLTRW